jgi:putative membrane protein
MLVLSLMLAGAATGFAQQASPTHPDRTITGHPNADNPVIGVDETDKGFMQHAAVGDLAEIQLGQLAQQKASSPAVKSFAARMVKDHSSADDKLKDIAESQHISLPNQLDPKHENAQKSLSQLSGTSFDKEYMLLMVQEHKQDVSKFQQEAANAHDPTVKQFAAQTLPILQSHLNEAQQVQSQVNK